MPRFVFSSRHGEYSRTLSLLESLSAEGTVSPADFTMSVHHALAGMLSIATANRRGHTALAAGQDTFGYGLMEAAACLMERPDEPVLLVHYDEPLPGPYKDFDEGDAGTVVAIALKALNGGTADIEVTAIPQGFQPTRPVEDLAAAFVRFLQSAEIESEACGERMIWRWRRV